MYRSKPYKGMSSSSKADLALKKANKALSRTSGIEWKSSTQGATASALLDSGSVNLINDIDQGDSNETRDGDSVVIQNVDCRYFATIHGSATNTSIRAMVVSDNAVNGAVFTLANLLHNATVNDGIVSQINMLFRKRLFIHYDRVHHLSQTGMNNISGKFKKRIKFKTIYDASGNGVADIQDNALFLVLLSNEPTNTPAITFSSRVRFTDM